VANIAGEQATIGRAATAADLGELLSLLDSVGLPREGAAEHLSDFLVARDEKGHVVGCVGMERHGQVALLRSAAVAPESQGTGLGRRLTAALIELARAEGVGEVVLLTTSARATFSPRSLASARRRAPTTMRGSPIRPSGACRVARRPS
jgi:amino-acid N-acetyltransferase